VLSSELVTAQGVERHHAPFDRQRRDHRGEGCPTK
jgi:hypothetical protein